MQFRARSSRVLHVGVRVAVSLTMTLSSADALAGSYDALLSSFGNQTEEEEKAARQIVLPADAQTPVHTEIAAKNLAALASQNSFPLRLAKDVAPHESWQAMPKGADKPKVLSKSYKVGACEFSIQSGTYTVRTYEEGRPGDYVIAEDSVMPRQTFSMIEGKPLHLSVATTVSAHIKNDTTSSCRKLFKGRRVPIGTASLSESELLAVQGGRSAIKASLAKEGSGTLLFARWNDDTQSLEVVDEFDMAPTLETGVFSLASPQKKGVYYLSWEARWGIEKLAH